MPEPKLYDPRGREIDLSALRRPPQVRAPIKPKVSFELDPERVVAMFKRADDGDPRDLQEIAGELERRDGHIGGNIRTRRRAVSRLTWTVETPADTKKDDGIEADIVAGVKRDLVDAAWFKRLCFDLLDSTMKAWSVAELSWETGSDVWRPIAATWVDQRQTVVDPADGITLKWRDPKDDQKGIDIKPYTAIVHDAGDVSGPLWTRGLMRVLALLYAIKRLGVRAWASFVELYGVPRLVAELSQTWSEKQIDDFQYHLDTWGHAGHLVVPPGARVTPQTIGSQAANEAAHAGLAGWCDDQASLAILGQTMTSRDGSSRSQAEVHERVAEWILEADAWELAGTLTRDAVEPYVRLNFGANAPVPLVVPQVQSSTWREFKLRVLEKLLPHGLKVEQSVARDLGGFPEPAPAAAVLEVSAPRQQGEQERGEENLRRARVSARPRGAARDEHQKRNETAGQPHQTHHRHATRVAFAEGDDKDFIDADVDTAASNWPQSMRPLVDTLTEAARDAAGEDDQSRYDDFLRRVAASQADGDELVRSVATWTMQARGVGDGTDEVT